MSRTTLIACQDCDLLQRIPPLPVGAKARCPRCGRVLAACPADPIDRPLALTIAAAILFVVANVEPMMSLSAAGRHSSTTIVGGAHQMWMDGEPVTAAIVAFCAVIAPALFVVTMLVVLLAAKRPRMPLWTTEVLRWATRMQPWAMYEVMLLGVLVALFKIAELASVEAGAGMYALGGLVVLFPAILVTFDPREIWARVPASDEPVGAGAARSGRAEAGV